MRQQAKATPEQVRIRPLDGRIPFGNGIVAIVNKHARQIWAMLAHDIDHGPCACLNHPMHQQTRAAHMTHAAWEKIRFIVERHRRQQVRPPRSGPDQPDGRPYGAAADPRAADSPMNERGLRVRFLNRSWSAASVQQDRPRKSSLAIVGPPCSIQTHPHHRLTFELPVRMRRFASGIHQNCTERFTLSNIGRQTMASDCLCERVISISRLETGILYCVTCQGEGPLTPARTYGITKTR